MSIATLGIGEIVGLVILNWESLTRGPMGVTGIPPLAAGPVELDSPQASYWVALAVLVLLGLLQSRLLTSHLGRTFRAIRDDDVAARAYGVSLDRYKGLAFAFAGFGGGGERGDRGTPVFLHQQRDVHLDRVDLRADDGDPRRDGQRAGRGARGGGAYGVAGAVPRHGGIPDADLRRWCSCC